MAKRSSRNQGVASVSLPLSTGIDYSKSSSDIDDSSLRLSRNGYYSPGSARWKSRPRITCVLSEANALPASIRVIRPHYNGTNSYLIAVSGVKIYQMSKAVLEGAAPAFTEIGTDEISSLTVKPSIVSYNSTLFVADNDTAIKTWSTAGAWGAVTNGPANPTVLVEARNRLWSNSTSDPDGVFASDPEWTTTDWTAGGGDLALRAGYGDGLGVNGLAVAPGGNDIVISKASSDLGAKMFRRLNITDTDPTNWFVSDPIATGWAAQSNPYAMIQAFNDVVFMADDGLHGLGGIQEYGDLRINNFGEKINSLLRQAGQVQCEELNYVSNLGALFCFLKSKSVFYVYTPWNGAFNAWDFGTEIITSMCDLGGYTYFATSAGRLYKLAIDDGVTVSTAADELVKGTTTNFTSSFRTKKFSFGNGTGKINRLIARYIPLTGGDCAIYSVSNDETTLTSLGNATIENSIPLIGGTEASVELIGGTEASTSLIGETGSSPAMATTRNSPRDSGLSVQMNFLNGARVEMNELALEFTVMR